jgi:PAS domain S-box-containing protein
LFRPIAIDRTDLQAVATRTDVRIVLLRDYVDGFARLSAGDIDAVAGDVQVAAYTIETRHLRGIVRAGEAFATFAGGIAVVKGHAVLLEEINAALRTISANGTLADIEARWRPQEMLFVSRERIHRLLLLSGGVVLMLLSASLAAWVVSLKKQIRAQRTAQSALERIRLLAQALRSASDCISITDTTDHILYVNHAFLTTYGYEERELLGQHISIVRSAANDPAVIASILPATKRDGWRGMVWNESKQGRVFPVSLVTSMVADDNGRPIAAVGVARDTTREMAAEEALRASEEKFFKIFQASPDCVAIVDFDSGQVLEVNDRVEQISGYVRSEVVGHPLSELGLFVEPSCRDIVANRLRDVGCIRDFEYKLRRRDGQIRTILWSADAIEVGGRSCHVSIHRDVTDQRVAEEALRLAESKYRLLVENANDIIFTVDREGFCLAMNRAGRDISGHAPDEARGISLQQLVVPEQAEEAWSKLHRVLDGESVPTFELDVITGAGERLTLEIDVRGIQGVDSTTGIQGIGRDVTARKGLEAQLRQAQKMEAVGRLAGGIAHDFNNLLTVRLTVTDTGAGMTKETLEQIFTPFFTTKGPTQGTGLGLATVHGIVQQAGGYIAVESEPRRGATFTIYLPQSEPSAECPAIIDASGDHVAAGTILLVDDDESIRTLGARTLRQLGYTVLTARHAAEAISLAERHGGPIDLLFTDLIMPGVNGRALAERLTRSLTGLKVLYTSGYAGNEIASRDVEEDFIQKPYTPESLGRAVREALDRHVSTPIPSSSPERELVPIE